MNVRRVAKLSMFWGIGALVVLSGCAMNRSAEEWTFDAAQPTPPAERSRPDAAMTLTRDAERDVARTLDLLHKAASEADATTYWRLFAANAVFLGTDATERWSIEQFKTYAAPIFERGQGWTYRVGERRISIDASNSVAWFDESLMNDKYGVCRGSGVLIKVYDHQPALTSSGERIVWKIAQYNLSVPIPNDLLPEFAERIRSADKGPTKK